MEVVTVSMKKNFEILKVLPSETVKVDDTQVGIEEDQQFGGLLPPKLPRGHVRPLTPYPETSPSSPQKETARFPAIPLRLLGCWD
jgi:hypothetical protein